MGSQSTCSNVVVWEFQDDFYQWIPYSTNVCDQIERAHNKGMTAFYLGDADQQLSPYAINFTKSKQVRQNTGTERLVRRSCYADFSCPGQGITWQWLGDQSGADWCSYTVAIQQEIESAYLNQSLTGPSQLNLEQFSLQLPYIIDFSTMTQTRKQTHNRRSIRRVFGRPYPSISALQSGSASNVSNAQAPLNSYNLRRTSSGPPSSASLYNNNNNKSNSVQPSTSTSSAASIGARVKSFLSPLGNLVRPSSNPPVTIARPVVSRRKSGPAIGKPSSIRIGTLSNKETVVNANPIQSISASSTLKNCTKVVENPENENCSICCENLTEASAYGDDLAVVALIKCKHIFHLACLEEMMKSSISTSCLQCPTCKEIHGMKIGNQPDGIMKYCTISHSLAGYENCDSIRVLYSFQGGTQGPEHPSPGQPYYATAFPRVGYLPNNEKGRMILRLLCIAWQRRLIFTIGTSVTSGQQNTVTWNEIHHKTELSSNFSGHGYPDDNYLDNVLLELAAQGVTEEDDA